MENEVDGDTNWCTWNGSLKAWKRRLDELGIGGRMETTLTTVFLRSAWILSNVPEIWADFLSHNISRTSYQTDNLAFLRWVQVQDRSPDTRGGSKMIQASSFRSQAINLASLNRVRALGYGLLRLEESHCYRAWHQCRLPGPMSGYLDRLPSKP